MKVILLKEVNKLGKEGSEVEVKPGYARNYLLPRGFAISAKSGNLKVLDEIKRQRAKFSEMELSKSKTLKEKIDEVSLTLTVEVKDEENIYGSITEAQIIKALKDEGITLGKAALTLEESIRKLGVYNLEVNLFGEVKANLRVWVVKK